MFNRRVLFTFIASMSIIAASGIVLAKQTHHQNGHALLGGKHKQNGKPKLNTAGKAKDIAQVRDRTVMGVTDDV